MLGQDGAEDDEESWIPEWYPLMVAAEQIGVPPWVLARQSKCWEEWALIKRSAEASAQEQKAKAHHTS